MLDYVYTAVLFATLYGIGKSIENLTQFYIDNYETLKRFKKQ